MALEQSAPLEVSVVSDVVCPWCFIGLHQLDAALAQWAAVPGRAAPVVRWFPFQLNPEMAPEGMLRDDYLRAKFGEASLEAIHQRLDAAAAQAGVQLALDRIVRQPNTLKAHALIALAGEADDAGLQHAVARALFEAYFQQGLDLTDDATLAGVARRAGLGEAAIAAALQPGGVADEVARTDTGLRQQGVNGVPLFVFGVHGVNHAAVSGAQGTPAILEAMSRTAAQGSAGGPV